MTMLTTLNPRTERGLKVALSAVEDGQERLGRALARCRVPRIRRRLGAQYLTLGMARVGIAERFGFEMLMR